MNKIAKNILKLKENLNKKIQLVAVSKTRNNDEIMNAYNANHKHFGENRVNELVTKSNLLPKDINWHMIGHLQRKKVKQIVPFIYLIHSVDSTKLLDEINKRALQHNKVVNCLLQVHIAQEKNKYGFHLNEIEKVLEASIKSHKNVSIKGLMGMATLTNDSNQISSEFKKLHTLYVKLNCLKILSMGMSNDYKVAIKNGSNMIRIGSALFKD